MGITPDVLEDTPDVLPMIREEIEDLRLTTEEGPQQYTSMFIDMRRIWEEIYNIHQEIINIGTNAGWFKLTGVGSNPMTGTRQTCSAGSFSGVSGAESTSIYIHPGSALANYAVNETIFASYVGDCWVSVNIFSSDDEVEDLIEETTPNVLEICGA